MSGLSALQGRHVGLAVAQVEACLGASFSFPPSCSLGETPSSCFAGVEVDSRRIRQGCLFVALPGARVDGHDYLAQAQQMGAGAAIVSRRPDSAPLDLPLLEVGDTLLALQELARQSLALLNVPVFGITGSLGKTGAKDALAHLLGGPKSGVHAAPASYNSEIGLPLAILAAPATTQHMVLEYGINDPGEMELLLSIARPDAAWLTPLAGVHLQGLGDLATVAQEKAKLVAAASSWWTQSSTLEFLRAHRALPASTAPRVVDLDLTQITGPPGQRSADFDSLGRVTVPVVADHELATLAVAAEIARSFGVSDEDLRVRLGTLSRPPGRLQIHTGDSLTVLNDAYNACPTSIRAALRVLATWPGSGPRLAVLGTMHELGRDSEEQHRALGVAAAALPLTLLCGVGPGGQWIVDAARQAGAPFATCTVADAAAAVLRLQVPLARDAVILLKASRAERLDLLVAPLTSPVPVPA